jgi:hypothetical protein
MILPANATFDLYRTVVDDGYGNETDDNTDPPLYVGIRGVLSFTTRIVKDPDTGTPQQQSFAFCLLPQRTDVRNGDRLHETGSGQWYNVSGVNALPSYGFPNDINVSLNRTGG